MMMSGAIPTFAEQLGPSRPHGPVGSTLLMLLAVAAYRLQLDSRTVPVAGIVGGVVATALTGWPAADFRPAVTRPLQEV